MKIVSVNLAQKTILQWKNRTVETGIFKKPVGHPIFLDLEKVKDDTVSDRRYHGGIEKAVYAYGQQHYTFWRERYPQVNGNFGLFGENLTIENLEEMEIHVGNQYACGEAIIEVTKPREPCYKLGLAFDNNQIIKDFWNSTKCGVYFKVIQTGNVSAGDALKLLKEMPNNPTIAEVYAEKRNANQK